MIDPWISFDRFFEYEEKSDDLTLHDLLFAGFQDAVREHEKNVRDTSRNYEGDIIDIQRYYHECGWTKILAANGKHEKYNEEDRDFWCGIFVAAMLSNLNDRLELSGRVIGLNPKLAYYVFPSTARIATEKKWNQAGFEMPKSIPPEDIKFGDIVCVKTHEKKEFGDHVVFAISGVSPGGTFETIEGNCHGRLGDGTHGEGVVRCRRHVRTVGNVVRLELKHFIGVEK